MHDPQSPIPNLDPAITAQPENHARRVALNAFNPFVAQIVTKLLMLVYTIVQFRLVAGESLGFYFLATIVFAYTGTISEWGLGTLVARDVARSRDTAQEAEQASSLFSHALVLRLIISLALFVPVSFFIAIYVGFFNVTVEGAWAIIILTLSLIPSAFSGSVTALYYAYERMSLPALIGVVTSTVNIGVGVAALLLGWGITGLSLAALATTLLTACLFFYLLRRHFPHIRLTPKIQNSRSDIATLLSTGWPLMLNALLVGLFFRADLFIIQASASSLDIARYEAAYRFLNFALLITPAVTLALFPRMSRHAVNDRPRLIYEYSFALKALAILSGPLVGLTVWFAPLLIAIVTGGQQGYYPQSAVALQILIFFLPFSFVNGVTQYLLIALDRQRLITWAFAATVIFNILSNLLLVPRMGIYGAAIATILSEVVLLVPFMAWIRRELGSLNLIALLLKPLLAGATLVLLAWAFWPIAAEQWSRSASDFALYLLGGLALLALYSLLLIAMRPFSQAELTGLKGVVRR